MTTLHVGKIDGENASPYVVGSMSYVKNDGAVSASVVILDRLVHP